MGREHSGFWYLLSNSAKIGRQLLCIQFRAKAIEVANDLYVAKAKEKGPVEPQK